MENNVLFSQIIADENILKAIKKLGYTHATPVQAESLMPMMEGKDVTVRAPTGTGKTVAFAIPIIERIDVTERTVQALIISPTRELAVQIGKAIDGLSQFKPGIKVATIYGGDPIEKQFAQLRKRPNIVVATPGRLIDHINRNTAKLNDVKILVLDEADRMLDMGFRPDINRILKTVHTERQTALFSATMSKEVLDIAKKYQKDTVFIEIEQAAKTVDTVEQKFTIVNIGEKTPEMIALMIKDHPKRTIIFTNTKKMTEKVSFSLKDNGYKVAFLHGDMRQGQRTRVMNLFKNGKIDVLVATDVAARGIDVEDIDMVINYDLPLDEDSYVHRIGRTGRAAKTGVAHTFIFHRELKDLERFIVSTGAVIKEHDALADENKEIKLPKQRNMSYKTKYKGKQDNKSRPRGRRDFKPGSGKPGSGKPGSSKPGAGKPSYNKQGKTNKKSDSKREDSYRTDK